MKSLIAYLALLFLTVLLHGCARDYARKYFKARTFTAEKLLSIEKTDHYFSSGRAGEIFVLEVYIKSLAKKPLKHIMLNVSLFGKDNKLIAKRRYAAEWDKPGYKEKYDSLRKKGLLHPGETKKASLIFYASYIEKETEEEKAKRSRNKKFRNLRVASFRERTPKRYTISVHSAIKVGDFKERKLIN